MTVGHGVTAGHGVTVGHNNVDLILYLRATRIAAAYVGWHQQSVYAAAAAAAAAEKNDATAAYRKTVPPERALATSATVAGNQISCNDCRDP